MRRQNCKRPWAQYMLMFLLKTLKNDQVLSGAGWHRKPGLPQILDSIRLYRKECAAGLVRVSPSDTFKAARLQWLRQMKKFPTVPVGQVFEKTCKGED